MIDIIVDILALIIAIPVAIFITNKVFKDECFICGKVLKKSDEQYYTDDKGDKITVCAECVKAIAHKE